MNLKSKLVLTLASLIVCGCCVNVSAQKRSEKRGVGEDTFAYPEEIQGLANGVSWYYNWGDTPPAAIAEFVGPGKLMDFLPMAWNGRFSEDKIRTYLTANPGVKYILAFNEPNFVKQANMSPSEAAQLWPRLQQIADDFNLKIVGPALNYSPDAPYQQPTKWYDEFFAALPTNARVDYLALHCYMNSSEATIGFIDEIAKRYGKKIWLTEFCAWDNKQVTLLTQISTMVDKIEALELSPNVEKYAWLKAKGATAPPYYPLLKYRNVSAGIEAGTLTELGEIYVNMSSFDLDHYYEMGQMIPATNYVKSKAVSLELNTDSESSNKLQLEVFSITRSVDYLVDVPAAGTYPLYIRMASEESPFNPNIEVYSDGNKIGAHEFAETGSVNNWQTKSMQVTLPAGKQRITLKSTKSTKCKLNWLSLNSTPSDITDNMNDSKLLVSQNGKQLLIDAGVEIENLSIIDMSGRTIMKTSDRQIDLSSFESGIYLVTVYFIDGSKEIRKCLIK